MALEDISLLQMVFHSQTFPPEREAAARTLDPKDPKTPIQFLTLGKTRRREDDSLATWMGVGC